MTPRSDSGEQGQCGGSERGCLDGRPSYPWHRWALPRALLRKTKESFPPVNVEKAWSWATRSSIQKSMLVPLGIPTLISNHREPPPGAEPTSRTSARAVPYLNGFYDGGIHKTSVYGVADARFFDANTVSATAGATHRYEAMRDLIFNFYGNYTRQTDLFTNALNFNNGAIGPNISGTPETNIPVILNPFGTTPSVNPASYNQYTGGASVLMTFENNTFASVSGTVFHIQYDHTTALPIGIPFSTSLDGTNYWATGRVGYNVTPQFYCLSKGREFSNGLTIPYLTRTDTEPLGALGRSSRPATAPIPEAGVSAKIG